MKPKHQGGYSSAHTELCERTLVTLLRGIGPWKQGIYLTGGLVPRYLLRSADADAPQLAEPHIGTTDIDLVIDLQVLANIDAYRRLEQNLKAMSFVRGTNDEGQPQHFSWRRRVQGELTIVVDLLCDTDQPSEGGKAFSVPDERRLSALKIPGAHLVVLDHVSVELTASLLDERGVADETIRVANVVPFVVLKALAYDNRAEEKDAYDLVYCLMHYGNGPEDLAAEFDDRLKRWSNEPLLHRALEILRRRFARDEKTSASRKDGPTSYSRFRTDPGRRDLDARHRQDAAAVVERFLTTIDRLQST